MTDDASLRLDKWLWFARFFKSRTLATHFLEAGKARMRGGVVKPAAQVRVGDVVTFSLRGAVRIVEVRSLGTRRGPALEARGLYEDYRRPCRRRAPLTHLRSNATRVLDGRPRPTGGRSNGCAAPTRLKPFPERLISARPRGCDREVGVLTQGRFPPPRPVRS